MPGLSQDMGSRCEEAKTWTIISILVNMLNTSVGLCVFPSVLFKILSTCIPSLLHFSFQLLSLRSRLPVNLTSTFHISLHAPPPPSATIPVFCVVLTSSPPLCQSHQPVELGGGKSASGRLLLPSSRELQCPSGRENARLRE